MKTSLASLLFATVSGTAFASDSPTPKFNEKIDALPSLSLAHVLRDPAFAGKPMVSPTNVSAIPTRAVQRSAPVRPTSRMPIIEPDATKDFKIAVVTPDPNVDFKIRNPLADAEPRK
jgi:hypothetical protein